MMIFNSYVKLPEGNHMVRKFMALGGSSIYMTCSECLDHQNNHHHPTEGNHAQSEIWRQLSHCWEEHHCAPPSDASYSWWTSPEAGESTKLQKEHIWAHACFTLTKTNVDPNYIKPRFKRRPRWANLLIQGLSFLVKTCEKKKNLQVKKCG